MHPRRLARSLALLAVVLLTAWLVPRWTERAPAPTRNPAAASSPAAAPGATDAPAEPSRPTSPPPAAREGAASPSPEVVAGPDVVTAAALDQARLMLRDFRTLTGENPVGTNAEIMRAVMGDNPRHATLGPPEGQTLNDQGELVDRWGTPLFFHQLSKTIMEIRSAGPDRTMWTEDDIVTR